jgi:hypothetical protein
MYWSYSWVENWSQLPYNAFRAIFYCWHGDLFIGFKEVLSAYILVAALAVILAGIRQQSVATF